MYIMKLECPLTVSLVGDCDGCYDEEPCEISAREAAKYVDHVLAQIKREEMPEETACGLMAYYGMWRCSETEVRVKEKVRAVRPTVEVIGGELTGVCYCAVTEKLSDAEYASLIGFIAGQYSDGWGEGFEQRDIRCSDGETINVSFWSSDESWSIKQTSWRDE